MQNQPNETPKIIGLTVAIVLVLVFAIWQYTKQTQSAPTSANSNNGLSGGSMSPNGTGTPNVTLASASGNSEAGAGQMRVFNDALDAEPGSVANTQIQPGRADAFRQFKPPVRNPAPPLVTAFPPPKWNSGLTGGGNSGPKPTPYGPTTIKVERIPDPPMEVKLDGVVLGSPSEAVLTVVDPASASKAGTTRTLYLKVGDRINKRLKIISITEAGIMLNGWTEIWLVGQTRTLGEQKTTAPAAATDNGKGNLLPSGLFTVSPPSSLTP